MSSVFVYAYFLFLLESKGLFIWEKVILTSEITFRLPNNFDQFIWDKFPLREKVLNKIRSYGTNIFPCTEISPINKRYLGTRENFSSHMNVR